MANLLLANDLYWMEAFGRFWFGEMLLVCQTFFPSNFPAIWYMQTFGCVSVSVCVVCVCAVCLSVSVSVCDCVCLSVFVRASVLGLE